MRKIKNISKRLSAVAMATLLTTTTVLAPMTTVQAGTKEKTQILELQENPSKYNTLSKEELQQYINVPDLQLKAAMNAALGQEATANITRKQALTITIIEEGSEIRDLTGIEECKNLEFLYLDNNEITDISPLSNLKKLSFLGLSRSKINDISVLSGLSLSELHLDNNEIVDISPLSNLEGITYLFLEKNKISDISPLSNLKELTYLTLQGNKISDMSPLRELSNLQRLSLDEEYTKDSSVIAILISLNKLSSVNGVNYKKWISEKKELQEYINIPDPNLRKVMNRELRQKATAKITRKQALGIIRLDGFDSKIRDLTGIEECKNLIDLALSYNEITDITALSDLKELKYLWLNSNKIENISALSNLTNLKSLHLEHNEITDISALSNLTNLISLHLIWNKITDISVLSNLTNLTSLSLYHNEITDISPLSNLQGLTSLSLDDNKISDMSPLGELSNLKVLYLDEEYIKDSSVIAVLDSLKNLKTVNEKKWLSEIERKNAEEIKNTVVKPAKSVLYLTGNAKNKKTQIKAKVKKGYTVKYVNKSSKLVTVNKKTGKVVAKKAGVAKVQVNFYKNGEHVGKKMVKITVKSN